METAMLVAQGAIDAGGAGAAVGGVFIFAIIALIVASLFWLWMLVDCLTSALPTMEKLIWVLVILFTYLLGAILYFVLARGRQPSGSLA